MVAIQGIGGAPEPKPGGAAKVRDTKERETAKATDAKDGVVISSEAQAAARVAQLIQAAVGKADVRAERVAIAKENIERGEYKKPEVVAKVAEKVSKYLP
jgi:anti-sigma28 factor (negative regulator of flagellin synthesis)